MIRSYSSWKQAIGIVTVASLLLVPTIVSGANRKGEWRSGGQNLKNTRYQATEEYLSPANVAKLSPKWVFTTGGNISATPAVVDGAVYVPDWGGNLFKIDAHKGTQIWAKSIAADYIKEPNIPVTFSRTSPAIQGNKVIIGSQEGGFLIAINKDTGELIWKTKLDDHPAAIITQSPVIFGNHAYVGVSSREEARATDPNYQCCTFRGSMTAVNLTTGEILWKTYTVPDNGDQPGGYSGAAVWGSTPAIDLKRKSVYITTGNNYDVPQTVKDCIANLPSQTPSDQSQCLDPNNHIDAIMALDLYTGEIKWSNKLQGYDAFTFSCYIGSTSNCPDPDGPDYDFAQAPMLFTVKNSTESRDLVGAGQKSGIFWALDADSGEVVWSTIVGPGGELGGIQWGSATDGQRIYVAISNSRFQPYTLVPSGETAQGGSWSALDPATGKIIWQTADPTGALDTAPLTVANGVVYAGSLAPLFGSLGLGQNNMYALDAETGNILWGFNSGGSVNAGAAVVDGTVYWGSGYSRFGVETQNNKLYAFTVLP